MTRSGTAEHLSLDEFADLSVGELPADAAAAANAHLAGCAACRTELALLTADTDSVTGGLSDLLASSGATAPGKVPAMPVTVAARLDRALAAESQARRGSAAAGSGHRDPASGAASGQPGKVVPFGRFVPLKAPATASYVKQTGVVKIMLAAAVAAAVVGFGGYVISAVAGLNEPSALSPTQVHPEALASQAGELAQSRDLDPHLFSAAWRCARTVTTGRITGITPVYVNGEQNYLVYTRTGGVTYATLVEGCDTSNPTAGRPVKLSE